MKKILIFVSAVFAASLFGADVQKTPDLLKKTELFDNVEMFEARSIYTDQKANVQLLKKYATDPKAFKDSQLFPIAICLLTTRDFRSAIDVLEKLDRAKPNNVAVLRTLGSVYFLARDMDKAVSAYKKAVELGDKPSVVYCCSALAMSGKTAEIGKYIPQLQELAESNLEALNLLVSYAIRSKDASAEAAVKAAQEKMDVRKVLRSATPETMRLTMRLYTEKPSLWATRALVVPARAAALFEQWPLALDCYGKVLQQNPADTLALRGMGLVNYRLGDVTAAAESIKKAFDNGDKDAAIDGVELFLLSKYKFVWDMFGDKFDVSKSSPDVRAGLLEYASQNDGCADMFFDSLEGEGADIFFKNQRLRDLIRKALDKYGSDSRSKAVAERWYKTGAQL